MLRSPPDPIAFKDEFWPTVVFDQKQEEVIRSCDENDETYVPAGQKLGKDFVTAYIILYGILTRRPFRCVTTSAKEPHLRVLWGEIKHFIDMCRVPLDAKKGGPLVVNHQEIKRAVTLPDGTRGLDPISYVIGMVASDETIAAMGGHHANPDTLEEANDGVWRTLFVADESSSVPTEYYETAKPWAQRVLAIGNTWPCNNFFRHAVKGKPGTSDRGGDQQRPPGDPRPGLRRKVIRIKAEDSPNVRYALAQIAAGLEPTNELIVPGMKPWVEYLSDREVDDEAWKAVVLDADFFEGKGSMLFPAEWLTRAERIAESLRLAGRSHRKAKGIGVDPAEGGDKTSMSAVDEFGLIEQTSRKTPNTDDVPREAIAFGTRMGWRTKEEFVNMIFDRGGGGKQHADRLRGMGYPVRSIGFGEGLAPDPKRGIHLFTAKLDAKESRFAYKRRRDQMYGQLREVLDPTGGIRGIGGARGFGIPREYAELRRQLAPIPLQYDEEGSLKLPPKNKPNRDSKVVTLSELLGCSPDEADSLVLSLHSLLTEDDRPEAGAI